MKGPGRGRGTGRAQACSASSTMQPTPHQQRARARAAAPRRRARQRRKATMLFVCGLTCPHPCQAPLHCWQDSQQLTPTLSPPASHLGSALGRAPPHRAGARASGGKPECYLYVPWPAQPIFMAATPAGSCTCTSHHLQPSQPPPPWGRARRAGRVTAAPASAQLLPQCYYYVPSPSHTLAMPPCTVGRPLSSPPPHPAPQPPP